MADWTEFSREAVGSGGAAVRARFAELSMVSTRHPIDVDGKTLPAGTRGTVVAAYSDGIGYEIEVFSRFHAVVTLEVGDLTA
jgi:hypothetical protein